VVGLPDLVGGAHDAELFHPVAQGIGVQAQNPSCTPGAFDNPVGLVQDGDDVVALDRLQGKLLLVGGRRVRFVPFYAAGDKNELVALVGSSGLLEIGARDGSAAAVTGLSRGAQVEVVPG